MKERMQAAIKLMLLIKCDDSMYEKIDLRSTHHCQPIYNLSQPKSEWVLTSCSKLCHLKPAALYTLVEYERIFSELKSIYCREEAVKLDARKVFIKWTPSMRTM